MTPFEVRCEVISCFLLSISAFCKNHGVVTYSALPVNLYANQGAHGTCIFLHTVRILLILSVVNGIHDKNITHHDVPEI